MSMSIEDWELIKIAAANTQDEFEKIVHKKEKEWIELAKQQAPTNEVLNKSYNI